MGVAGTTGTLNGTITDDKGQPVSGATVSVASPSQTATATTDDKGRYVFIALAPDTYTITVQKTGFRSVNSGGITVNADQSLTQDFTEARVASEIGRVTSRSADSLIRPGQTLSEYTITPGQQQAAAALGGGANLNQASSALASIPGVYVPLTQPGWGQSIFIRGGDYTQTGNEVDGIPINRAFDQYPGSSLSSLGNQEVQVYVGDAPANAQATGLAGVANQVIKTGTYPGYVAGTVGSGAPSLYQHFNLEVSGATPNRLISWYAATGGYNQELRVVNQFNGAGYLASSGLGSIYNFVATGCGTAHPSAGCYTNGSPFLGGAPYAPNGYAVADTLWGTSVTSVWDRETIANLHFGLARKDGGKNDIQFLYDYGINRNVPNTSMASWGPQLSDVLNGTVGATANLGTCPATSGSGYVPFGTAGWAATSCQLGVNPAYIDPNLYTGPINTTFTAANLGSVSTRYFPNSPGGRALGAPVDLTRQDSEIDEFAIAKLQYQQALGSNGYARLYGYTFYSNRLDNGIVGLYQTYVGTFSPDYTIYSHTHGFALDSGYQLGNHLLGFNAGYVTSNAQRFRDDTVGGGGATSQIAYLVNSANPTAGCYSVQGGAPVLVSCSSSTAAGYVSSAAAPVLVPKKYTDPTTTTKVASPTVGTETALTCGSGPCQYYAVNSGLLAAYNTVTPNFFNTSISDSWKPFPNLTLTGTLRLDSFNYVMQNTNTLGNQLFANSYNASHCISGTTITAIALGGTCPAGTSPTTLSASSPNLSTGDLLQPRFGASYSLNPYNVLRASWGRYIQPAETSSIQATNIQAGTADTGFYSQFGFNSFSRPISPEISYNADFSWEHQFRGTDLSSRITPFYRVTQNEFASILVDPKTNFVAFVNGLNRTAKGVELAFNKGDFNRNGIAARLAYTYTWATDKFKVFPTGGSFVSAANQAIGNYNSYTKFCATNATDPRCTAASAPVAAAAPCYAAGTPDATCTLPGTVANPYYFQPPQGLMDPNGQYFPYNQSIAAGNTQGSSSYLIPHVLTALVQWKHDRLRITPSVEFQAGSRYGTPFASGGVAPDTCSALPGSAAATDPRYAGTGAFQGNGYDAASCTGSVFIPNPYTGKFDTIGQFVQPNLLDVNLQVSYDVSSKATLQFTAANVIANCFGGSNVPWTVGGRVGCGYQNALAVGNFYNPGDTVQPGFQYPYAPLIGSSLQSIGQQALNPVQLYLELHFHNL